MSSPSRDLLPGVQILRAVAAVMVVLNHALRETNSPDWLTTLGAAGVDVFFVISGFIMVYVTFPEGRLSETPGSFFYKRLTRIAPLYWVCAGLTLLMWSVGLYQHLNPHPEMIFRSLFFLPTDSRLVIVSWTLVFEMYFYVLFAISLLFRSRAASILFTSIAIASMLYLGRFAADHETADYLTRPVALEFCFGMGLAYAFQRWPSIFVHARHFWVLGFAAMIAAQFIDNPYYAQGWTRIVGWGLPALLIVASMLTMRVARSRWEQAAVRLGDASYALYLTHPFVMITYAWFLHHVPAFAALPQFGFALLAALLAIPLGLIAHRKVELPLVRLVRCLGGLRRRETLHPA